MTPFGRLRKGAPAALLLLLFALLTGTVAVAFTDAGKALPGKTAYSVTMGGCLPCHRNIEKAKVPNLKFSHAAHFKKDVNCSGCHLEFPHFRDRTERIPMRVCFYCHGASHGNKTLARADCSYCHRRTDNLRPKSHGPREGQYKGAGHVAPAKADISGCYMCHRKKGFCHDCHNKQGVTESDIYDKEKEAATAAMKKLEKKSSNDFDPKVLADIQAGEPVRTSFCFPCHSSESIESAKVTGLIYQHQAHFKKGIRCISCHESNPHQGGETKRVPEEVCHYCHGVQHGNKIIAKRNCLLCHPPGFDLSHDMLPIELRADWGTRHNEVFKAGKINCYRCHTDDDCIKCHLARNARPATHRQAAFSLTHGRRPTKDLKQCKVCHYKDWCNTCHKTEMPHPPLWYQQHTAPAPRKRDCYICHEEKMCQQCHHTEGLKLEMKVCEECHKKVADKTILTPSLKFNHFAHLTKQKVKCTQCHVSEDPGHNEKFKMESCYAKSCHGFNAKAPAACMFCHPTDFKLTPSTHAVRNWSTKGHSRSAVKDKKACAVCHEEKFCFACHQAPMPHPDDFSKSHGKYAKRNVQGCRRCHDAYNECRSCHHKEWKKGTNWKFEHSAVVLEKGSGDCFDCHQPTDCARCHLTGKSIFSF